MNCSVLSPLSGRPPTVFPRRVHGIGLLNDLKGERVLQENFALSTHNFYKENPDISTLRLHQKGTITLALAQQLAHTSPLCQHTWGSGSAG